MMDGVKESASLVKLDRSQSKMQLESVISELSVAAAIFPDTLLITSERLKHPEKFHVDSKAAHDMAVSRSMEVLTQRAASPIHSSRGDVVYITESSRTIGAKTFRSYSVDKITHQGNQI
jgi:hypothetical protein